MNLILTGDFHLDATTAGHPRHDEVVRAFEQLIERASERRADAVVFLGDLCNPDRGTRTLRSVTAGIAMIRRLTDRVGCAAILVAGNHDVVQDSTGLTSLSPIRAAFPGQDPQPYDLPVHSPQDVPGAPRDDRAGKSRRGGCATIPGPTLAGQCGVPGFLVTPGVVAVTERPTLLRVSGSGVDYVDILTLPFVSSVLPYDPVEAVRVTALWRQSVRTDDAPFVVAGHLQLEGALLGSETTDMARGRDVAFPVAEATQYATLMCNGHYHKRQTVRGVECPGSLARLAFGEESNEPRWLEVDL